MEFITPARGWSALRHTWMRKGLRNVRVLIQRVIVLLKLIRALATRRLWRVEVEGSSMFPTLRSGQILFCEAYPRTEALRVGEIVVFGRGKLLPRSMAPNQPAHLDTAPLAVVGAEVTSPGQRSVEREAGYDDFGIKRLAALPGQTCFSSGTTVLPAGYCEVLGDNAARSADSRMFGAIPLRYIVARAISSPPMRSPRTAAGGEHR